jgi:hypothetical protein
VPGIGVCGEPHIGLWYGLHVYIDSQYMAPLVLSGSPLYTHIQYVLIIIDWVLFGFD